MKKSLVLTAALFLFTRLLFAGPPADSCACNTSYISLSDATFRAEQYTIMRQCLKDQDLGALCKFLDAIESQKPNATLLPNPMYTTLTTIVQRYCDSIVGNPDAIADSAPKGPSAVKMASDFEAFKCAMACEAVNTKLNLVPQVENPDQLESPMVGLKAPPLRNDISDWEPDLVFWILLSVLLCVIIYFVYSNFMSKRKEKKRTAQQASGFNQEKYLEDNKNYIILWLIEKGYRIEKIPEVGPSSAKQAEAPLVKIEEAVVITLPEAPVKSPPLAKSVSEFYLYAELPTGTILNRIGKSFHPQATYFKIILNSEESRTGILTLHEDEATRIHAFSMIDSLKNACELHSTGSPSNVARVTIINGTVELLENGYWQIKEKIKLNW